MADGFSFAYSLAGSRGEASLVLEAVPGGLPCGAVLAFYTEQDRLVAYVDPARLGEALKALEELLQEPQALEYRAGEVEGKRVLLVAGERKVGESTAEVPMAAKCSLELPREYHRLTLENKTRILTTTPQSLDGDGYWLEAYTANNKTIIEVETQKPLLIELEGPGETRLLTLKPVAIGPEALAHTIAAAVGEAETPREALEKIKQALETNCNQPTPVKANPGQVREAIKQALETNPPRTTTCIEYQAQKTCHGTKLQETLLEKLLNNTTLTTYTGTCTAVATGCALATGGRLWEAVIDGVAACALPAALAPLIRHEALLAYRETGHLLHIPFLPPPLSPILAPSSYKGATGVALQAASIAAGPFAKLGLVPGITVEHALKYYYSRRPNIPLLTLDPAAFLANTLFGTGEARKAVDMILTGARPETAKINLYLAAQTYRELEGGVEQAFLRALEKTGDPVQALKELSKKYERKVAEKAAMAMKEALEELGISDVEIDVDRGVVRIGREGGEAERVVARGEDLVREAEELSRGTGSPRSIEDIAEEAERALETLRKQEARANMLRQLARGAVCTTAALLGGTIATYTLTGTTPLTPPPTLTIKIIKEKLVLTGDGETLEIPIINTQNQQGGGG